MSNKIVYQSRKAYYDYSILETYECGIVLTGTEIKSVRAGNLNLKDSYAEFENGELWLIGAYISPYEKEVHYNHEPERNRKLLLHKHELIKVKTKVSEKGLTLVPLSVYIKDERYAKVELALARGKTNYDKRHAIINRETKRDIGRALRRRR